jgi:hypothetical protein
MTVKESERLKVLMFKSTLTTGESAEKKELYNKWKIEDDEQEYKYWKSRQVCY